MDTNYFKAPESISVRNQELQIRRNLTVERIALSEISKIFLKKRKTGLFTSVFNMASLLLDNLYDLHVCTIDNREITVRISAKDRPYLREVISSIRRSRKQGRDTVSGTTSYAG